MAELQAAGFNTLDVGKQVLLAIRPLQITSLAGRNALIIVSIYSYRSYLRACGVVRGTLQNHQLLIMSQKDWVILFKSREYDYRTGESFTKFLIGESEWYNEILHLKCGSVYDE